MESSRLFGGDTCLEYIKYTLCKCNSCIAQLIDRCRRYVEYTASRAIKFRIPLECSGVFWKDMLYDSIYVVPDFDKGGSHVTNNQYLMCAEIEI